MHRWIRFSCFFYWISFNMKISRVSVFLIILTNQELQETVRQVHSGLRIRVFGKRQISIPEDLLDLYSWNIFCIRYIMSSVLCFHELFRQDFTFILAWWDQYLIYRNIKFLTCQTFGVRMLGTHSDKMNLRVEFPTLRV